MSDIDLDVRDMIQSGASDDEIMAEYPGIIGVEDLKRVSHVVAEGPFTGIGKMMMKHKLKKGIRQDQDDEDDAFDNMHDYDFDDELRFGHEDEFKAAYDAKHRKEKALARLSRKGVAENFADGKNPGRKGLANRSGVNTKASVSDLRKTAKNSSGEYDESIDKLRHMAGIGANARSNHGIREGEPGYQITPRSLVAREMLKLRDIEQGK